MSMRVFILLLIQLALAAPAAQAATREITGTTAAGASFRMAAPDGWHAGGALVVVNHGYGFELDRDPDLGPLRELWLAEGYAIAASGYRQRGWALFSALDDNVDLVQRFSTEFGAPGSLIAAGGSMGGLISLKMLDDARFANLAGAYALCAPADAQSAWDFAFDLRQAYDAVCNEVTGAKLPRGDEPLTWALNPGDIPDNLNDFERSTDVLRTLIPVTICTGLGLNENLRLSQQKDRLATLMRYAQVTDEDFFTTNLAYAIYGLSDLVRAPDKLGNRNAFDSRYSGIFAGSTPAIDARIPALAPDVFARADFARASVPARITNVEPDGQVQKPVVALYTSRDELVRPYHAQRITGARTLLGRVTEASPTHCGFTDAEAAGGWLALTRQIAGTPTPESGSQRVQLLAAACEEARAGGAAGPCRIGPALAGDASTGVPRARAADLGKVSRLSSGLWYDPARSGEGVLLEVLPDNRVLAGWFTYPPATVPGAQQWIFGTGTWAGNGVTVTPATTAQGARFGAAFDPAAVQLSNWGSFTLALDTATGFSVPRQQGRLRYAGPAAYGSGEYPSTQLTGLLYSGSAEFSPPLPTEAAYMGTFYDPARNGEGIMLTQDFSTLQAGVVAPQVFVAWFSYDLTGRPLWLFGTAHGSRGQYQIDFQRPIGTHFGAGFNTGDVLRPAWGTATLAFQGCNRFSIAYNALDPAFGSGQITLQRITAPIGTSVACPTP